MEREREREREREGGGGGEGEGGEGEGGRERRYHQAHKRAWQDYITHEPKVSASCNEVAIPSATISGNSGAVGVVLLKQPSHHLIEH